MICTESCTLPRPVLFITLGGALPTRARGLVISGGLNPISTLEEAADPSVSLISDIG